MRSYILTLTFILCFSCSVNPFTGKKTLAFIPNSKILPMSFAEYDKFLSENDVVENSKNSRLIKKVGQRISDAAKLWLDANNFQGYLKNYQWEYNLINDETINAWCMPGGKIVFYTGILPIAENESGIAAIMGHEVAHALANHGQQRLSAGLLQQVGAIIGNLSIEDEEHRAIFNTAYGVTSTYGAMLPFSRFHENEADKIGLYIMAIAGYNPYEAHRLWERMRDVNKGKKSPPEFLSTHPSNENRIKSLKLLASEAENIARKFGVTSFKKN